jgi:hypothetical protein
MQRKGETQPEEIVMKLQQAYLLVSEETPIADAMRSVAAGCVSKVAQADRFKGHQAIAYDGCRPQGNIHACRHGLA